MLWISKKVTHVQKFIILFIKIILNKESHNSGSSCLKQFYQNPIINVILSMIDKLESIKFIFIETQSDLAVLHVGKASAALFINPSWSWTLIFSKHEWNWSSRVSKSKLF